MTNPERHVLDEIDQLMAQGLDEHGVPLDDYSKDRYVKCELCQGDWHGLPMPGCPGAYAIDEQRGGPVFTGMQIVTCLIPGVGEFSGYVVMSDLIESVQLPVYHVDMEHQWNPVVVLEDSVSDTPEIGGVAP